MNSRKIKEFQAFIFSWWEKNRRDLPWRHTHDPYRILVSEIMLQQTQVQRVIPKYAEFIEAYPTAAALAKATTADVLRIWKGMGYNRRALYLKKAAEVGIFPKSEQELVKLPGVGKYTARALLVFAYKQNVAAVDTNIRQIITHFFFADTPQEEKSIQKVADALVPIGKSWEWHQALMDYGALALNAPHAPRSLAVPFKQTNRFFRGRIIDELRQGPKKEIELLDDFAQKYDRSEDFLKKILLSLEKDMLVVRRNSIVDLPD